MATGPMNDDRVQLTGKQRIITWAISIYSGMPTVALYENVKPSDAARPTYDCLLFWIDDGRIIDFAG
jgi:hypothetical protein